MEMAFGVLLLDRERLQMPEMQQQLQLPLVLESMFFSGVLAMVFVLLAMTK
jgi:hypothetical protein